MVEKMDKRAQELDREVIILMYHFLSKSLVNNLNFEISNNNNYLIVTYKIFILFLKLNVFL